MATQVRVTGLVSFTTTATVVIFASGGSEEGGEGEDCSQFCIHRTCHKLPMQVCMHIHNSVDQT